MSEMIERVARALCNRLESVSSDDGNTLDDWMKGHGDYYRSLAKAAIEVLREPTPKMKSLGAKSIGKSMGIENHTERSNQCWQAMIDEALK